MYKNVLFCILIIIVGLLFSLPFLDGIIVKRKFVGLLQTINNQHLQIKLLHYHRGWFSSTALVAVKLPKEKVSSRLILNIHHGPLISASASQPVTKLAWAFFNINADFETPTLKKYLPIRLSAKASAYWYFNSQLTGNLQIEKLNASGYRHNINIIWPGVTTKFCYSLSTQKWSFNGIIGGINIRWLHNNVNVSPVLFSSSGRIYLQHQWLGELQMHAPLIIWKKNDTTKFLAQNVNLSRAHNAASGQRLNYVDKLDIAMFNYQKYRYSPLQFEGICNNLTVNALSKQHELTSQWWASVYEQHAILQPSNSINKVQQLISAYKKILIQGGSIHNQSTMHTSLGMMRFNLSLGLIPRRSRRTIPG